MVGGDEITVIKVSIETMLSFAVAMFIPSVAAAWALLHALVFRPLNSLKEEIGSLNANFTRVSEKQLKLESDHHTLVLIHESRFERIEQDIREIKHELN